MPASTLPVFPQTVFNPWKMRVYLAVNALAMVTGNTYTVPFDTVDYDPTKGWDGPNFWYVIPASGTWKFSTNANVNIAVNHDGLAWYIFLKHMRSVTVIHQSQHNTIAG